MDKPGRLDAQEWEAMKRHAAYTEVILSRVKAFESIAFIAASHHERLDGKKGYPARHRRRSDPVRNADHHDCADVFDALTVERQPIAAAMPISKALAIMEKEVGTAIDARCFAALNSGAGEHAGGRGGVGLRGRPPVRRRP